MNRTVLFSDMLDKLKEYARYEETESNLRAIHNTGPCGNVYYEDCHCIIALALSEVENTRMRMVNELYKEMIGKDNG